MVSLQTHAIRALFAVLMAGLTLGVARAQPCQPEWESLSSVPPGLNGPVYAIAVFDDGDGPALFVGGDFSMAGATPVSNLARWDGMAWSNPGAGVNAPVRALATYTESAGERLFVGGDFTVAGSINANRIARWNGSQWSTLRQGVSGCSSIGCIPSVEALAVHDDGTGPALFVGGRFNIAGTSFVGNIARWQNGAWSSLGAFMNDPSIFAPVQAMASYDDGTGLSLFVGGSFTTVGGMTANRIARWNGSSWTTLGAGPNNGIPGADLSVTSLAVYDDGTGAGLYVGGQFSVISGVTYGNIARWDSAGWSSLQGSQYSGTFGKVYALLTYDDGSGIALYVAGFFTNAGGGGPLASRVARWNGTAWSVLGSGVSSSARALASFDDGSGPALYLGGFHTTAGGIAAPNIARWNGAAWSALQEIADLDSEGRALLVYDDGDGAALYAGGSFMTAGGVISGGVARWDGLAWSPLGEGFNGAVNALASFDDGSGPAIYAGGAFTASGATGVTGIARWDGVAWQPVGAALGGPGTPTVYALAVYDDGTGPALHAAGNFTTADGVTVNRIARWDGDSWSALGSGLGSLVFTLCVFDDGDGPALYAGGWFTTAGGVSASRVAKWDGAAWSNLGSGVTGGAVIVSVDALEVFDDGSGPALYVGGNFGNAGGSPASRIARWNGASWSSLGSGVTGGDGSFTWVRSLHVFDDGTGAALYAGGDFSIAGGQSAGNIARWSGSLWSGLGAGVALGNNNTTVLAMATFDDGGPPAPALYVTGDFGVAGANSANNIARWRPCELPAPCNPADINYASATTPAVPGWGVPDGLLSAADFTAFVSFFQSGDLRADINTSTALSPASPGWGVPDGVISPADFSAFVFFFQQGCP